MYPTKLIQSMTTKICLGQKIIDKQKEIMVLMGRELLKAGMIINMDTVASSDELDELFKAYEAIKETKMD